MLVTNFTSDCVIIDCCVGLLPDQQDCSKTQRNFVLVMVSQFGMKQKRPQKLNHKETVYMILLWYVSDH